MSNSRLSTEFSVGLVFVVVASVAVTLMSVTLRNASVATFGALLIVATAALPAVQRMSRSMVVLASLTVALGVAVGSANSAAAVAGISGVFLLGGLAGHMLGSLVGGVSDAVESALYGLRARPLEQALPELRSELARSRRYDRPLSLLVIRPISFQGDLDDGTLGWLRLTSLLADGIRETDLLLQTSGKFVVVSPETGESELAIVRHRLAESMKRSGLQADIGSASFPTDGTSLETLIEAANRVTRHRLEQEIA